MIQDMFGFQFQFSEFSGYGVGGFTIGAMSAKQRRRLRSRHEITIRHHAGDHPFLVEDANGLAALNFGIYSAKFSTMFAAVDSIMI